MSITFEQVSFSYNPLSKRQIKAGETPKYALKNVSFSLEDGEFLAIAGHTGSGKSTLTQHLNGLVHPAEGRVLWKGKILRIKKPRLKPAATLVLSSNTPNTNSLPHRYTKMLLSVHETLGFPLVKSRNAFEKRLIKLIFLSMN